MRAYSQVYNYTEVTFERAKALPLYEAAAAGGSPLGALALGHRHAASARQAHSRANLRK